MLTFFRRIRKGLLGSGQARKHASSLIERYILYAIGEIALVVIGILIALQINNWNENRKQRIEEINALKEIRENLTASANILSGKIEGAAVSLNSMRVIIDHLSNDLPYHDSLNHHLQFMWWSPNSFPRSGIETLKSKGLGLISNDSVRIEIINYYDVVESTFLANATDAEIMRFRNYMMNEFIDYFSFRFEEVGDEITGLVPKNYQELINDDRVESIIRDWYSHRKYLNQFRKEMVLSIKKLIEVISKDLDRME